MNSKNAFIEYDVDEINAAPEIFELNIISGGCVVIHMNHRGAWGSEGYYLFTNLKDDLIAIAKWAHNPAITDQYDIDTENIFLVGDSMGGQTVLNAAKDLHFIKGVVDRGGIRYSCATGKDA